MSEKRGTDLAETPPVAEGGADASTADHPSAEAVAAYLRTHPDFFDGRDSLLAELELPHGSRGSVSLVERQVALLRERNIDTRRRLNELLRNARTNHQIFEQTLAITGALLEAEDLPTLVGRFETGLAEGFELDAVRLCVLAREPQPHVLHDALPVLEASEAERTVGGLLRSGRIVCGVLREAELAFLFPDAEGSVGSAAVMPVSLPGGTLVVALGSSDQRHFSPDMGTLFFRFLGETLGRLATRMLARDTGAAAARDATGAA
jgi:uncharacterized protein YigA (DUF484 family)